VPAQPTDPNPNSPRHVTAETWLVTPGELAAAHVFYNPDGPLTQPGVLNTPVSAVNVSTSAVWLVAVYLDPTHWNLAAVDAINDDVLDATGTGLHGLAMPRSVTTLLDHAALGACPNPSIHPVTLTSAHLPPECTLSQLDARYAGRRTVNGETELLVAVANTGTKTCGLQGTPDEITITGAGRGQIAAGGWNFPVASDWAVPVVVLRPATRTMSDAVADPAQLPAGTAWLGLTDQATETAAAHCPPTPLTGFSLSLPFNGAMPEAANRIATIGVADPPATVDDCGDGFLATPFQNP
jgi:hypothetical protein